MAGAASRRVAIWIDDREAVLLAFEADPFASTCPHRPRNPCSETRVAAQQYSLPEQYYAAVLSLLQPGDEILIVGPAQAKGELRHQIEQQGTLKGKIVGLYEAFSLAKVELVFPISSGWRLDESGTTQTMPLIPQSVPEFPEQRRH
jgi:hypothetical protein